MCSYSNYLVPTEPENIGGAIQVDKCIEFIRACKLNLIEVLCLHVPGLKIDGSNRKSLYIPVITVTIITIAPEHLFPDLPTSLVQATKAVSVFEFSWLHKRKSSFGKT